MVFMGISYTTDFVHFEIFTLLLFVIQQSFELYFDVHCHSYTSSIISNPHGIGY